MSEVAAERNPYLTVVIIHGPPEITGHELKVSADKELIEGWDFEIGDPSAVAAGVRCFKGRNLAILFPGNITSEKYWQRRPAEFLESAKGRDVVLEIHDRPDTTGEFAYLDWESDARLLRVAKALGMKTILLSARKNVLRAHNPRAMDLEFCRADSLDLDRIATNEAWLLNCMKLVNLQGLDGLPDASPNEFAFYEFVQAVHASRAKELGLFETDELAPFDSIQPETVKKLGLPKDEYVADAWNGANSSHGEWFGNVLRRIVRPLINAQGMFEPVLH